MLLHNIFYDWFWAYIERTRVGSFYCNSISIGEKKNNSEKCYISITIYIRSSSFSLHVLLEKIK